jgi:hypothetical protein
METGQYNTEQNLRPNSSERSRGAPLNYTEENA